jgi:hypothetical protein
MFLCMKQFHGVTLVFKKLQILDHFGFRSFGLVLTGLCGVLGKCHSRCMHWALEAQKRGEYDIILCTLEKQRATSNLYPPRKHY